MLGLSIVAVAAATLAVETAQLPSRWSPPLGTTSQATIAQGISVPPCSRISLSWTELAGLTIGFAVYQGGEAAIASHCPQSVPTVADPANYCPPAVCVPGVPSAGPGPVIYQTGTHGEATFLDTQGSISFVENYSPNSSYSANDRVAVFFNESVWTEAFDAGAVGLVVGSAVSGGGAILALVLPSVWKTRGQAG